MVPTRGDVGSNPNHGQVILLDDDGTPMPGWPRTFEDYVTSSPAVADLDGDGTLDILFTTGSDSVEARSMDGHSLPGWPQSMLMNQDILSSPGVADVDGDGSLDVAVASGNGTIALWHADGSPFSGFPFRFTGAVGNIIPARGSPTLANLDADEDLELVLGNTEGWIAAFNPDASFVDGFPIKLDGPADGGVLVADLNGDGTNEMAISCFDRAIYVYRTAGRPLADVGWPMFRHDPRRTGYVNAPVTEAVEPRLHLAALQAPLLPGSATLYAVSTRAPADGIHASLDGVSLAMEEADARRWFYRAAVALEPGAHHLVASATARDGATGEATLDFDVVSVPFPREWVPAEEAGVALWTEDPSALPPLLLAQRAEGPVPLEFRAWMPPGLGSIRVQVGPSGRTAPPGTRLRFTVPGTWATTAVAWWDGARWREQEPIASEPGRVTIAADGFGWFRLTPGGDHGGQRPPAVGVSSAGPNPFPVSTAVTVSLREATRVEAAVFDLRGRLVRRVAEGNLSAGRHVLSWDGRDLRGRRVPPGAYWFRVTAGKRTVTRKVVRIAGGGS